MTSNDTGSLDVSRRNFLLGSAAAGAGLALTQNSLGQAEGQGGASTGAGSDDLNVALIGVGQQGRVLMNAMLNIPGIRFKAVCDIWSYSQRYGSRYLKKFGHEVTVYEDYREMLDKEKDLDAAVIATPDWMHAEHAIACMQAGLDVYCEKEMSNDLEKAKQMLLTQRQTGRLLQIGHQRRSNPRYLHAIDNLVLGEKILGRVTQANAQWNRAKTPDLTWAKSYTLDQAQLDKYGYESMHHLLNWRWYRKYGGGPIVDLGSHQIDIFAWIFRTNPKSVMAGGGIDYYPQHEWYDNVMAIYEYENDEGIGRAFYQVLTTTQHGGYYETFMGENGALIISENPHRGNAFEREAHAPQWDRFVKQGSLKGLREPIQNTASKNVVLDVRVTAEAGKWPIPVELAKPAHQPHLENFFGAIRIGTPLNCPGELGYETAVAVLRVNEAVETQTKLEFKPEDFHV